ncbi:MAG: type II secretion system F family protein [Chloroflexi bacterium]|nr:type II secretion system F family protein [Chloroflexota bacterium]
MESFLAFVAVGAMLALVVGAERLFRPDTSHIDRRLLQYGTRRLDLEDMAAQQRRSGAMADQVTRSVERAFAGRSFGQALQTDLARADLKLTVGEFLVTQGVCVIVCAALAYLISGTGVASFFFALVGYVAPRWWVKQRQTGRLKKFSNQLPDTITLMGNSLRSGLSLVQSMELISREGEPPIADEFQRVVREIGLGVNPQDALRHMVRRIASDDLDLLVTAILVQFEVGGNLAKILDTIAFTIRERVKIKGEIKTLTAQQRGSGMMLAGMPGALGGLFLLINPNYIGKLFKFPYLILPIVAAMGVFFGFLIINKITDIEV